MNKEKTSSTSCFWKVYTVIMAVDLLAYVLILNAGRVIPPPPGSSFPGNYLLMIGWIFAHFPAFLIYWKNSHFPDSLLWLLILQDAWWAWIVVLWKRRRRKNDA